MDIIEIAKGIRGLIDVPQELNFLIKYAKEAKVGLIEIGAFFGRSSVCLASVAKEKKIPLFSVDTWDS